MITLDEIRRNYEDVCARIEDASARAGAKEDVRLIAVTKTHPIELVQLAREAGMHTFGENRPQELAAKAPQLVDATWCAIGQLQRNKAKDIAAHADEFHALDSLKVADALERRLERTLDVFVQVNVSGEQQKSGVAPEDAAEFLAALTHEHLRVRGLMTIARNDDEAVVRKNFADLRELRDALLPDFPQVRELSMGMSGDFEWAIEEGATSVRVGSALFGRRQAM
ncbi:YggS family pyridoxal phosphate-dependent enzyme [Corynebacterium pseudopelargi]|uniref:Pyridoxal phosphate homeostasis protein n=1 Tax=Corynebacterium pseudopelargi TaxID=2080757 RepID=A0A3G6IVS2_9CORY|nr:YggS family pyridoxal phosphate-dependent enzyme [Corynebacterium pseudopelargi]AZA08768.1 hypothetical protein CPPEL_03185 [Corynebacterium pseudopelargi]